MGHPTFFPQDKDVTVRAYVYKQPSPEVARGQLLTIYVLLSPTQLREPPNDKLEKEP